MNRHQHRRRAAVFQILESLNELPRIEPAEPHVDVAEHLRAEIETGDDDGRTSHADIRRRRFHPRDSRRRRLRRTCRSAPAARGVTD